MPRPPFPKNLTEFQRQFATEAACEDYLARCRWPNGFVCPLLAEAAWAYQGKPRIGRKHAYRQEGLPKVVCDIAWKAQLRLTARFRRLVARGKAKPKVATAIARELTGFIWAIAQEVSPAPQ